MEISLSRKEPWKQSLLGCWRILSLRRKKNAGLRLELYWQRILCFGALLAVFVYACAAIGLYAWRASIPYNQVRFTDIAFPWNWRHMDARLAETNFKRAEHNLEEENFREAYFEGRAAYIRYPAHLGARLLVARLLASANPETAIRTLRQGYHYAYPEDDVYDKLFLALALRTEDYDALREIIPVMIRELKKQPQTEETKKRIEAFYVALLQSQMKLKDYVTARRTLDQIDKEGIQMQTLPLRLLVLTQMGAFADFDKLVQSLPQRERDSSSIAMLRAQSAYDRNDIESAQIYIGRALAGSPSNPTTYTDGIRLLLQMGQIGKAEEYVDLYLFYNSKNAQAIQRLAAILTDWPSSFLVSKVKLWSLVNHRAQYPMMLFYEVQALFREGKFEESKEAYENWKQYIPQDHKDYRYVEAYEALFDSILSSSENSRQRLLEVLADAVRNNKAFPEEIYWVTADAHRRLGRYDLAEEVINQGMNTYPNTLTLPPLRRQVREERLRLDGVQQGRPRQGKGVGIDIGLIDSTMGADALLDAESGR